MVNCQNIFFQMRTHTLFNNSDRDFYSENNNVSQVYTYITKIQKNAMHFDSFSLGARHLFQKLVLFFLCQVILVIHCCFQNKNLSEFLKETRYIPI
jgi:hypothetical protein